MRPCISEIPDNLPNVVRKAAPTLEFAKKEARTVHDLIENTAFSLDLIEKQDGRK